MMSSIPGNTQVQNQGHLDLQYPLRTAKEMEFIERLVGDVNPTNPKASIIKRMGYFVVDCFNAIAELFGRLRGSKEVLAQIELRSKLHSLAVELGPHSLVNEPKFQDQIAPKIKEVTSAFFDRVEELDSKLREYQDIESQDHLFLRTMQALSNTRRNPIPAVNPEDLKKAFVIIDLQEKAVEAYPKQPTSIRTVSDRTAALIVGIGSVALFIESTLIAIHAIRPIINQNLMPYFVLTYFPLLSFNISVLAGFLCSKSGY